jgi:hypothetical protein
MKLPFLRILICRLLNIVVSITHSLIFKAQAWGFALSEEKETYFRNFLKENKSEFCMSFSRLRRYNIVCTSLQVAGDLFHS